MYLKKKKNFWAWYLTTCLPEMQRVKSTSSCNFDGSDTQLHNPLRSVQRYFSTLSLLIQLQGNFHSPIEPFFSHSILLLQIYFIPFSWKISDRIVQSWRCLINESSSRRSYVRFIRMVDVIVRTVLLHMGILSFDDFLPTIMVNFQSFFGMLLFLFCFDFVEVELDLFGCVN